MEYSEVFGSGKKYIKKIYKKIYKNLIIQFHKGYGKGVSNP